MKKKILLFGGFGFIGKNITHYIDRYYLEKYEVVVFDWSDRISPDKCIIDVFSGDFSDVDIIRNIFEKHTFDFVIHSISTTVPATSKNIRFDIETNLISTIELLKLLVEYKTKNIIYLSSGGAIYGNTENKVKHKESDLTMPLSSYGIVKLTIEKYLYHFFHNFGIQPTILRLSNPYGPFHYSDKQGVINIAIRAALANKEFSIWGDGTSKKDYIFIEDVCFILMKFLENQPINQIINIGSGTVLSLNTILNSVKENFLDFCWSYVPTKNFDVPHLELDISLLKTLIGDLRFTKLDEGLSKTIMWEREQYKQDTRQYLMQKTIMR